MTSPGETPEKRKASDVGEKRHREIMAGIEYRAALIRFLAVEATRDEGLGGWRKDYSMERDMLWSEIRELERELYGEALEAARGVE